MATPTSQLVSEIHLCSGIYQPTCAELPAVEVFCQTIVLNGVAYVWIDGINQNNPLLLPVQALYGFRRMGSLRQYLENERHLDLGEDFDALIDLCTQRKVSATVLIRACEIMHAEESSADQALETALHWGMLLNEMDQAERAAYQMVTTDKSSQPSELIATALH